MRFKCVCDFFVLIIISVVMQNNSVEKNLKDFESLLEKCKKILIQIKTTLRLSPSSIKWWTTSQPAAKARNYRLNKSLISWKWTRKMKEMSMMILCIMTMPKSRYYCFLFRNLFWDRLSSLLKVISIPNNTSKQSKSIIWMTRHLTTKSEPCLTDFISQ